MDLASRISTGIKIGPQINVIMGDNGVGKTTFACSPSNSIVIDLEKGSNHIDVQRITDINNLKDFRDVIVALRDLPFENIVIDSSSYLEALITTHLCKKAGVDSIENVGGGYGKGFTHTREIMTEIMQDLQELRDKYNKNVNIVAHTQVKTHNDPVDNVTYDRVVMRGNDKVSSVVKDLSNNVLYATYEVFTKKDDAKDKKSKAFGDGSRVLFTQWRPAFDAKNRLNLPFKLPLSYADFKSAIEGAKPMSAADLITEVKGMIASLPKGKQAPATKSLEAAKDDLVQLNVIKNYIISLIN